MAPSDEQLSSDDEPPVSGQRRRSTLPSGNGGGGMLNGRAVCNMSRKLAAKGADANSTGIDPFARFRFAAAPTPAAQEPSTEATTGGLIGKRTSPESPVHVSDSDGTPVKPLARRKVMLSDTDGETPTPAPRRRLVRAGEQRDCPVIDLCETPVRSAVDVEDDDNGALEIEEDEKQGEEEVSVVARCEKISKSLRDALGSSSVKGDRWCETEAEGNTLVNHADLARACGEIGHSLKSYQLVGINFLLLLKRSNIPGAILADEMGLGKTAQTIAFLGLLRSMEGDPGPHLIVVPVSLLENWRRELTRWCPRLRTVVYYGKDRRQIREELLHRRSMGERFGDAGAGVDDEDEEDEVVEVEESGQSEGEVEEVEDEEEDAVQDAHLPFNVMLTGYSLFERDSQDQKLDREFLRKWEWSHMIMDEAHALKNRNSHRTQRLRKLSMQCKRRIMLTGTPLQNDLGELAGLLTFLLPDIITSYEELEDEDLSHEEQVQQMKSILAPFIMRRMKSEVAKQLTQKEQVLEFIELEGGQKELYEQTVADYCATAKGSAGKSDLDGGKADASALVGRLGAKRVKNIFVELRKVSQHPLLVRRHFKDADLEGIANVAYSRGVFGEQCSRARVLEELQTYSDFQLHCLAADNPGPLAAHLLPAEKLCDSVKFRALRRIIDRLRAAGSRPLIFSQWTTCLDLLGCLMDHLGLRYLRLDGSTQVQERLELCDQFNDPEGGVFAFLLSTRAGGQGLNLTGADTVILHDVDFNPQIDRQAEDRCHRLGQSRPVTVIRLVAKDTVDHDILRVATRKLELDAAVLDSCTTEVGGDTALNDNALVSGDEGSIQAELMRRILERNLSSSGTE